MATSERRWIFWLLLLIVAGALIYLLRGALFPFLAGMAIAYLLDPLADRLEELGCPRWLAVTIILGIFLAVVIIVLLVVVPVLISQITGLISRIPDYVERLRALAEPLVIELRHQLTKEQEAQVEETIGRYAGDAVAWLGHMLGSLLSGGIALFNLLSLIVVMPVVAFYMLRDWDRLVARVDALLPRDAAETIRAQAREINDRLSGFVRGQALVCLCLGVWYAVGLSLVGVDFALLVGLGAGLISFIPYLGTATGLVVGIGLAFVQFGDWVSVALVAAVFTTGQMLEGTLLTPKLVGDRVGLHPVWVLFALMTGGALLGFTGVLLAVPVAAAIGVLVRFAVDRYLNSPLYQRGVTIIRPDQPALTEPIEEDGQGEVVRQP